MVIKKKNDKPAKASAKEAKADNKPSAKVASKRPALGGAINDLEKQYGKGVIQRAGETLEIDFVPTGIIGLDSLLGGGAAKGRVYEVMGPESSGKTTLATLMAASFQRKGEPVAFVDAEQAYDKRYAKDLGYDLDNPELSVYSQPDSAEQALDIVCKLAESKTVGLTILDSIAALVPQKELDGEMDKESMGLLARLMGKFLRKVTGPANKNNNTVVLINQIRMKIGVMYGSPETTPGGQAPKFFASTRADVRKVDTIKDSKGQVIGIENKIKIIKNKTAPTAFMERTFKLYWGAGYDKIGDLISVASENNVITRRGAFFYIGEEKLGQGITQAAASLANKEDVLRQVFVATAEALIKRKLLPNSYLDHTDFIIDGMKGGVVSPLLAEEAGAEEESDDTTEAAS